MATRAAAIKAVLTGSAQWTALCAATETYLLDDLGRMGLTPEVAAVDSAGKLKNSCVITFNTSIPAELPQTSERVFVNLYFFTDSSYPTLRLMQRKAKDLLHRKQIKADTEGAPFLVWVNDTAERPDESMGGALSCSSRYIVQFRRV